MPSEAVLHADANNCTEFPVLVKQEKEKEGQSLRKHDFTTSYFGLEKTISPHFATGIFKIKSEPVQQDKGDSPSSQTLNEVPPDGMQKIDPKGNFLSMSEEQEIQIKIDNQYFEKGTTSDGDLKDMNAHSRQQQSNKKEKEAIDVKSIENDAHSGKSNEEQISLKRTLSSMNGKYHMPLYHKVQEAEPTNLTHEKPWLPKEIHKEHYSLRDYEHIRSYPTLFYPTTKDRTEFLNYDKMNNRLQAHMSGYGLYGIPPEYRAALYDKFYPSIPDALKTRLPYMSTDAMENSAFPVSEEAYMKAYNDEMMHRVHQSQFGSAFKKPAHHGERITKGLKSHEQEMASFLPYFNQYPPRERSLDKDFKREEEQNEQRRTFPQEYRAYGSNFFMMQPKLDTLYKQGNVRSLKDFAELSYGMTLAERPYMTNKSPAFQDKPHQEAKCIYPCCTNTATFGDARKDSNVDVVPSPLFSAYASLHETTTKREQQEEEKISRTDRNSSFEEFLVAEREAIMRKQYAQNGLEDKACTKTQQQQNAPNQMLDTKTNKISTWRYKKGGTVEADGKASTSTTNAQSGESLGIDKVRLIEKEETNAKTEGNFHQIQVNIASTEKPSTQECEPAQKKISCSVCNKTFNRTSNLYTHMRTHSAHKPHACEFCGKRFHQKADLRIHRYIHTGEKPHKCTKCGRGFKQLTHLKYHMRTHSDIRMYKCPYCEKGFNQKSNLQAHIFGHTGQRPHKCDVCGKGFTLASTLNTHKRTHLPNKPFKCQFCERAFYQKNALKMHYVSTHPYSSGAV